MGYHTQILPIRYSSRRRLEVGLKEVFENGDFHIDAFENEQWTVRVPHELTPDQIKTIKAKMSEEKHYASF